MSLKKGGAPATLPVTLTITGQGSTDKLDLVYHNRRGSEVQAKLQAPGATIASVIPYIVAEWSTDFELTEEGVIEFEDEYPGIVVAIFDGYHKARNKAAEKN
jgi:hypothetical protein